MKEDILETLRRVEESPTGRKPYKNLSEKIEKADISDEELKQMEQAAQRAADLAYYNAIQNKLMKRKRHKVPRETMDQVEHELKEHCREQDYERREAGEKAKSSLKELAAEGILCTTRSRSKHGRLYLNREKLPVGTQVMKTASLSSIKFKPGTIEHIIEPQDIDELSIYSLVNLLEDLGEVKSAEE